MDIVINIINAIIMSDIQVSLYKGSIQVCKLILVDEVSPVIVGGKIKLFLFFKLKKCTLLHLIERLFIFQFEN